MSHIPTTAPTTTIIITKYHQTTTTTSAIACEGGDSEDDDDGDVDDDVFFYLQTTADDRLVYIPWKSQKPTSFTGRLPRGLVQPKSTSVSLSLPPRSSPRRTGYCLPPPFGNVHCVVRVRACYRQIINVTEKKRLNIAVAATDCRGSAVGAFEYAIHLDVTTGTGAHW